MLQGYFQQQSAKMHETAITYFTLHALLHKRSCKKKKKKCHMYSLSQKFLSHSARDGIRHQVL